MRAFKKLDGYQKRGLIYAIISLTGICYELFFVQPLRMTVLLLWTGVLVIGIIVFFTLKEPED